MKRILTTVLVLALVSLAALAFAQGKSEMKAHGMGMGGKTGTWKGEVLDSGCYISHNAQGAKHKECAMKCASEGMPLLLLVVVLASSLLAIHWFKDRRLEQQQAAAEQQRRRFQVQCRLDRQRLQPLIDSFRRSQQRVVAIEAEGYLPSAAPAPLDPDEQRRLAVYDQESSSIPSL